MPHYWRGDEYPKIRRLLFKFVANTNTRINQLKSGEVHVVALVPWDKYREIASCRRSSSHKTPGNAYEHVTLNERQFPPFADVRVRRALHRRARSRAVRAHDPRRPGAGRARADSAGVVGLHRSRSRATRSIRRRPARCSTRPAGRPGRTASAQRDGTAARLHADHAGRLRRSAKTSRRRSSVSCATSASTSRSSCTTAPRSARSGSRAASTRCCTGGRCRRIPS